MRRSYPALLTINGRRIHKIIVDDHYEAKHPEINDELILRLVLGLDRKEFELKRRVGEWEFFTEDPLTYQGKRYRLVWCLCDELNFVGVINCFRRS